MLSTKGLRSKKKYLGFITLLVLYTFIVQILLSKVIPNCSGVYPSTLPLTYIKTKSADQNRMSKFVLKQHTDKVNRRYNILSATANNPLDFIPDISDVTHEDIVPYVKEDIVRPFLELQDSNYTRTVVILSPIRNSAKFLDRFGNTVRKLSYPHSLLSLYFGESQSSDNTIAKATTAADTIKDIHQFKDTGVFKLNISGGLYGNVSIRHRKENQLSRRSHLAKARNQLVRFALEQSRFDYVLWIDSDVAGFQADLVQQMLFANSDVVATSCLLRSGSYKVKFDRNSWRETNSSLIQQSSMEPEALIVEGYSPTRRIFLPDLKAEGRVVPLDGVGGCALMVKADCYRSGLQFPEIVYKHHIETEGLAKMARDMGYSVVGLPFVEIFHGQNT